MRERLDMGAPVSEPEATMKEVATVERFIEDLNLRDLGGKKAEALVQLYYPAGRVPVQHAELRLDAQPVAVLGVNISGNTPRSGVGLLIEVLVVSIGASLPWSQAEPILDVCRKRGIRVQ